MRTFLDQMGGRAADAVDEVAVGRVDRLTLDGLRRRRRMRQLRRSVVGVAGVVALVVMAAVLIRPDTDGGVLLEQPEAEVLELLSERPGCDGLPGTEPCRPSEPLSELPVPTPVPAPAADGAWQALPDAPLRPASGAAAVWTGSEFIVWGGYAGIGSADERAVAQAGAFAPTTDRWRELPDAPIPGAYGGEAVWTGAEVWVFGGFGGEAGRQPMLGAAAYDPATNTWRVLPSLPQPMVAAAWLQTRVAMIGADGTAWTLGPDDDGWVQDEAAGADQPFRAVGGDGALLVVTDDRLRTFTAAGAFGLRGEATEDMLGLSATAQDQPIGIAATSPFDGDPTLDTTSTVIIGQTATTVSTLGRSLHWRQEGPPAAAFLSDVHAVDDRRLVAVDAASGGIELLDIAAGGWQPLAPPPHASGAMAAGDGMVFVWGGSTRDSVDASLLTLAPLTGGEWPPGRAAAEVSSFTSSPMAPGLPADLHPDPGSVPPPVVTPPAVWSARVSDDGTPVLLQTTNDPTQSRTTQLPGPPLTALALGDVIWAAGANDSDGGGGGDDDGVRVVQATWDEVVPHVGTITLPVDLDLQRPLHLAPVTGGVWISGLIADTDQVLIRIDQDSGDTTAQVHSSAAVFAADTPGEVLLADAGTLTRVDATDLRPTRPPVPLPTGLETVTNVWDDRGRTVVAGHDAAGRTLVWDAAATETHEAQLSDPVVSADANLEDNMLVLATASGTIEVVDLTDLDQGRTINLDHPSPIRHVRIGPSRQLESAHADGSTSATRLDAD